MYKKNRKKIGVRIMREKNQNYGKRNRKYQEKKSNLRMKILLSQRLNNLNNLNLHKAILLPNPKNHLQTQYHKNLKK